MGRFTLVQGQPEMAGLTKETRHFSAPCRNTLRERSKVGRAPPWCTRQMTATSAARQPAFGVSRSVAACRYHSTAVRRPGPGGAGRVLLEGTARGFWVGNRTPAPLPRARYRPLLTRFAAAGKRGGGTRLPGRAGNGCQRGNAHITSRRHWHRPTPLRWRAHRRASCPRASTPVQAPR